LTFVVARLTDKLMEMKFVALIADAENEGGHSEAGRSDLRATIKLRRTHHRAVTSPLCKSLTSTMLCGFLLLMSRAASIA
jgi:hypothetical protein